MQTLVWFAVRVSTYLHKAVIRREVVPHRISPAFVVPFEEWEKCTDFFEDLETKEKCQNIFKYIMQWAKDEF